MDEKKKAVLKAFAKEFGRGDEAASEQAHSYLYLKHTNHYVYNMQASINHLKPHPDELVKPQGPEEDAVDDMIKIYSSQVNRKALDVKTNSYHGKIMHVNDAKKLFKLTKDLNLPDLPKTIIPYEQARATVLKDPQNLCVINCPCREARGEKGCYPRDVCIIIGEPWVSFVMEFNKSSHPRRITQEEALQIVERQHKAGNVHSLFYKVNGRTYALCNCCPCCCTCMLAFKYAHSPVMVGAGYKAEVDDSQCVGCGSCEKTCGFDAISCATGVAVVDKDKCMGCGACESQCPIGGIKMIPDDPTVCEPLDIEKLAPETLE